MWLTFVCDDMFDVMFCWAMTIALHNMYVWLESGCLKVMPHAFDESATGVGYNYTVADTCRFAEACLSHLARYQPFFIH